MSKKMSLIAAAICLAFAATGATYAAEAAHEGPAMPGMHEGMKDGKHGKRCHMEGGMKCGHQRPDMLVLPRLPAGNEKLQLQMHAEILQKIGEIEAKYAGQLH